jgi:hypothetical protein
MALILFLVPLLQLVVAVVAAQPYKQVILVGQVAVGQFLVGAVRLERLDKVMLVVRTTQHITLLAVVVALAQ